MLLAVMLGYADENLRRDHCNGTACLGSRRAAMEVFDLDKDGLVTADDVNRVARYLGEDLTRQEIDEMMRAIDSHHYTSIPSKPNKRGVPTARLRHLLPPLYPAHSLQRGDVVFSAGEIDPRFYVLLQGDVLVSHTFNLRPRSGYVGSNKRKKSEPKGILPNLFAGKKDSDLKRSSPFSGRDFNLGLHRLEEGQSFGETELLEASVADVLPRASTATCASSHCELLSIPGHLFQLLSDVFDGVQTPLRDQAEARAKLLVWSWVGALVAHSVSSEDPAHGVATRKSFEPGDSAWSNRAYAKGSPLGRTLDLMQKHGQVSLSRRLTGIEKQQQQQKDKGGHDNISLRRDTQMTPSSSSSSPATNNKKMSASSVKPSRFDTFLVVEDGVVEVTVADARTGARRVHTLWPRDFVYCNERPNNHPLDAKAEFSKTVVVDVTAVTSAQLAFVHGDVFQQALNQPAMQFVKIYLVDRFRELPPVQKTEEERRKDKLRRRQTSISAPPPKTSSS